ncbi:putative vacuolar protein sorting-associated protein Ist1 [Lupinus albus]|uniref:Putative vacuolar protein sorting-associated protein Ist1 n=1 Tax=Lupinus albus TaxID=3870 RepID=A0A6A4QNZ0_LUPAL|nr:putative vacuolar protein sorting-associated protein Ist1 [Lupinus albus]
MEIRMKALQKIAAEIGVTLHFEQDDPILINENKPNEDQRLDELEPRKYSNTDDRKRYKDAVSAVQEALELASFGIEVSTEHSNHGTALAKVHVDPMVNTNSKPEDKVISRSNHLDLEELEIRVREITKQFAREESNSSQNPRDNIQASENTELECNAAL